MHRPGGRGGPLLSELDPLASGLREGARSDLVLNHWGDNIVGCRKEQQKAVSPTVGPAPGVPSPRDTEDSACVHVNLQHQDAESIFGITGPPELRSDSLSQEASKSEAGRVPPGGAWGLLAPRTVENSILPLSGACRAVCLELPRAKPTCMRL